MSGQITISVKDASNNITNVFSTPAVGQDSSANSLPVVIASDQSNVPVTVSGNVSGITSVVTVNGSVGFTNNSVVISGTPSVSVSGNVSGITNPVSVANFPATQPINAVSLPLPSGAAQANLQPALNVDGGALAHITNFPSNQQVSAVSLPLPSGAAQANLQPALNGDGGALAHVTNFPATQTITGTVGVNNFPAVQNVSGSSVSVTNFPATQPVSAVSLPLPSGAAQANLQPALNGDGGSLAHITNFPATQTIAGTVSVNNFPSVQNVSGSSVSVSNFPALQNTSPIPNIYWNEAVGNSSAVNASGTFTGTARYVGVASNTGHGRSYYSASFQSDQGGTANIRASNDGVNFRIVATSALTAAAPALTLQVPVVTSYYQAQVINGNVAQGYLWVDNGFTGA